VQIISNEPDAPGLAWAQAQGLPTDVLAHRDFSSREAFDLALADRIDEHAPDYILLAGFMRILSPAFVQRFSTASSTSIHRCCPLSPASKHTKEPCRLALAGTDARFMW